MTPTEDDASWLPRRERKRVYALRKALIRLQENELRGNDAWLAEAKELLNISLRADSPVLSELSDSLQKSGDKRTESVSALLGAAARTIVLQPVATGSILDDVALATVGGEAADSARDAFEMKRALYASFVQSWPLRITLILLLIALGLVGWQVTELASAGVRAQATVRTAQLELDNAQIELARAQNQIEAVVGKAQSDSASTRRQLEEARTEQKNIEIQIDNTRKSAIAEINMLRDSSRSQLEGLGSAGAREVAGAQQTAIEAIGNALVEKESEISTQLEGFKGRAKDTIEGAENAALMDLKSFTTDVRSNNEAALEIHLAQQIKRLTDRTNRLTTSLAGWEGAAEKQVGAVVASVEAQEKQWNERHEKRVGEADDLAKSLEGRLDSLEKRYEADVLLFKQIAVVVDGVREETPAWVVAVLELRTIITVFAAIGAFLAAGFAWRARARGAADP